MEATTPKKLIIVGGGFAGLNLAQRLAANHQFTITLVDKNNYNFFPPLLYQVATGFLEAATISYPFRRLFQKKNNLRFRMAEVTQIQPTQRTIKTSTGELSYDYLILATGTQTNFFGNQNVKEKALPMKTITDALALRNHLLQKLEQASVATDPDERKKLMTIVIAGAGPSGVEIAGMLAQMRSHSLRKDYPELVSLESAIYLVNSGSVVLEPMSKESQQDTQKALLQLGIKLIMNTKVVDYTDNQVRLADGQSISTYSLIWTSGVTGVTLPGLPAESIGRGNRVKVNEFNEVLGTECIFAIGDGCLQTTDTNYPMGHPQLAQVAIQQGRLLAKNLLHHVQGRPMRSFSYKNKGSMAIIGRNKAVADLPHSHVNGIIAFLMWGVVHLFSLITAHNRFMTLLNWLTAYFTQNPALRFIIRTDRVTQPTSMSHAEQDG